MNKKMRLEPKSQTKIKLFGYSGNICAYPHCQKVIINKNEIIIGDICHIEAAEPTGKRYNPNQSPEERRSFDNLILLCKTHHKIVDSDEIIYNVDVLKNMKKEHEKRYNKNEIEDFNVFLKQINDKLDEQQKKQKPLSIIPHYDTKKLIGRQDMIDNLHKMLTENKSAILMNGIGGIGKTTVALAYCNTEKYQKEYQNIVWVTLTQSLKESIINTFIDKDIDFKYNEKEDTDKNFNHLLNTLRNITGNNLLVLDNANNDKEILEVKSEMGDIHWKLLITSRCSIPNFNEIVVDELSHDDAVFLFLRFYHKDDREMLDELINQINRHTLLTELLANVANENPELNIRKVFDILKNWEIKANILQSEILTQHQLNNEKKQELIKIGNYLLAIFKATELNDDEKKYLIYFSILPSFSIKYFDLKKYFAVVDDNSTTFNDILKSLKRKGWITETEKDSYKMHPLIQTVIREKLQPNAENCEEIINIFIYYLSFSLTDNPLEKKNFTEFAENILKNIDENIENISILSSWLAEVYRYLGKYQESLIYSLKTLLIDEKILPLDHPELAKSYSNVALTYNKLNDLGKSISYNLKAITIREKVLSNNDSDLAISYHNIADTYYNLGDYNNSIKYTVKAIKIREKILPYYHPYLAQSYNNLALLLNDLNYYEEALKYGLKAIEINEKIYPKDHPFLEPSYNNIAGTYRYLKNYGEALKYDLKAKEICEKTMPENHPNLATTYTNIGITYNYLGIYEKALEYQKKSIVILEKVLDINHPDLAACYNNISFTYFYMKDYIQAKFYIDKAVGILKIALSEDHSNLIKSLEWQKAINDALNNQ